ncbi:MAG: protein kinase [Deltaproteobacteria bacterium]|uniref:non-specific serine/threonine protein kinase n=1 Tax=Candidatus Zymogenus saltonus TaxID=2844893 RepID=A0A9D8KEI3_9DELT|nr:protein kinase [Candidatus Zymogenus saltonus]
MGVCPQCGLKNRVGAKFCNECAAPLTGSGDPFIGTTIDKRYRVERKIAEGGMGAIYLATQVRIKRKIALKILHPDLARDKKFLDRFINEAVTSAGLKHENIVQVIDSGPVSVRDTFFIAMEFVDGETLTEIIKRKAPLPVRYSFNVALEVAHGLSHAHRIGQGIIHRDVKPGNIMIEKSGRVVLTDFGIAKAVGGKGQTTTGSIIGTPDYMSLEQVKGQQLDGRSDIYSLGVVLYEMLTGVSPFRMDSGVSTITKIVSEEAVPIKSLRSNLPDWAASIVTRAMAKKRSERFQSADEFIRAVEAGLAGIGVAGRIEKVIRGEKLKGRDKGDTFRRAISSSFNKTRVMGEDIRAALTQVIGKAQEKVTKGPLAKKGVLTNDQSLFLFALLIIGVVSILFALADSIVYGLVITKKMGDSWLYVLDVMDYIIIAVLWIFLIYISDPKKGAFLGGLYSLVVFIAVNLLNLIFVKKFGINPYRFIFSLAFGTAIGTFFGFSISLLAGFIKAGFPRRTALILLSISFVVHMGLIFILQDYVFRILFTAIFGLHGK